MKVVGIHTSPNHEGMSSYLLRAALRGAQRAGADTEIVYVHGYELQSCRTCNEGWGTCRTEGHCELPDRFEEIRAKIDAADAVVFCTPVYFGDVSKTPSGCWTAGGAACSGARVAAEGEAGHRDCRGGLRRRLHRAAPSERYFTTLQFTLVDLVPVTLRNLPWREPGLRWPARAWSRRWREERVGPGVSDGGVEQEYEALVARVQACWRCPRMEGGGGCWGRPTATRARRC